MRKIRLENCKVVAVYEHPDEYTPSEAIEHPDLQLGDILNEDGTIIKYVPESIESPKQIKALTQEDLLTQTHAMLTYLLYADNSTPTT